MTLSSTKGTREHPDSLERREGDGMTTPTEKLENDALVAGTVAADTLRGIEIAAVVLIGLLVCPPLAIMVVVVVVPLLVIALAGALLVAVLSLPYLLVHHFRSSDRRHLTLLTDRLRGAARALRDLAPHRIVADARRAGGVSAAPRPRPRSEPSPPGTGGGPS
jgi:Flp pilus assembly protein TadB